MAWCYLDLADFLFIAEAVLDIPAEDLARVGRLELADSALHAPGAEFGGVEFYPDLARKTAVLASRLIGNHPLPDGNNRWLPVRARFHRAQRRDVDPPTRRPGG
jgi:death on curing protein